MGQKENIKKCRRKKRWGGKIINIKISSNENSPLKIYSNSSHKSVWLVTVIKNIF